MPQPRLASRPQRRRTVISLTPLIDVVFILLVFFMLASSFLDWRAIELAAPSTSRGQPSDDTPLLIEVRQEGLRLDGRTLSLDSVAHEVAERLRQEPGQRVLVRPAAGVALQRAVDVLDRLVAAGAADISLIRAPGS